MDNTWLIPFTKEVGVPAIMAITFIWYFVRVFFPEQKVMMLEWAKEQKITTIETVKLLTEKFQESLLKSQEFHERMMHQSMAHNLEIHTALNKRIDNMVTEIIEFREEISRRLDGIGKKETTHNISA